MALFSSRKIDDYIESFLLVIGVSIVLNAIPNILFPGWKFMKHFGFSFILLAYYLIMPRKKLWGKIEGKFGFISLIIFFPIAAGGVSEFVRMFLKDTVGHNPGFVLITVILLLMFYLFLKTIYQKYLGRMSKEDALKKLIKPYFLLATIIVCLSVLVFILILVGAIDPYDWPLPSAFGEDFTKRMERGYENYQGDTYYLNPLRVAVLMPNYIKVDTPLGAFGSFCGLSYEPHIGGFFAAPAMFMLPIFIKNQWKKLLLYLTFIIYFLLAASTTNLLGVALVFFFQLIQKTFYNPFKMFFVNAFIVLTVIGMAIAFSDFLDPFMGLIEKKMGSTGKGDSAGVSVGYIDYLLSPTELVGDGMFIVPDYRVNFINWDIGYFYSFLFIIHYLIIIGGALLLMTSRSFLAYIGFGFMYYVIHSLKFPLHAIRYPFSIFMLFLLIVSITIYLPKLKEQFKHV